MLKHLLWSFLGPIVMTPPFFLIKKWVIFGTYGLKYLFFGTLVSIRITHGTWVLGKDGLSTFVYVSVQILTDCHISTT
jgi:hypothetical protein